MAETDVCPKCGKPRTARHVLFGLKKPSSGIDTMLHDDTSRNVCGDGIR